MPTLISLDVRSLSNIYSFYLSSECAIPGSQRNSTHENKGDGCHPHGRHTSIYARQVAGDHWYGTGVHTTYPGEREIARETAAIYKGQLSRYTDIFDILIDRRYSAQIL